MYCLNYPLSVVSFNYLDLKCKDYHLDKNNVTYIYLNITVIYLFFVYKLNNSIVEGRRGEGNGDLEVRGMYVESPVR